MSALRSLAAALALLSAGLCAAQPYFVSPAGDDANPGTLEKPFATLHRAQTAARQARGDVFLRGGMHYLDTTLVLTAEDSGSPHAPFVIRNYQDEPAVVSGGVRLENLDWQPSPAPHAHAPATGVYQTIVPADLRTEEIFINGERQILARYPNFDPNAQYFDGFAADAVSAQRAARWANPVGGYYHAMHPAFWGDFTWRITGKNEKGEPSLEGGWQNNRGAAAHDKVRFVENIFEELDAPGEWFLDADTRTLYFYPAAGLDLKNAVVEATRLRTLVEFRGDAAQPVRWVTLRGLVFRHAERTVMDNREPLLRSDWTIHRGGAVFFNGAEDCALEDAFIDQVGGNAVFVNKYNRRVAVRGTRIARAGANGVCFVGDPQAARSPLFNYHHTQDLERIDRTPGPRTHDYPADCLVEDCLITLTGRVEKQTAGVQIELSRRITVRHCSIYDMPRAGVNIGSGCWGGHLVEFCDVFDTVKETGDHGSFNSWGRDRFWRPSIDEVNTVVARAPDLPLLDVVEPVRLLNNRWRCDHGWDIDLDDGSSNYVIRNNLSLRGGIKLREGFKRLVENNIFVDGGYDPHVWYANSGDIFRRNIVWTDYRPAHMPPPPWGEALDFNLVHSAASTTGAPAVRLQEQSGRDQHSLVADARFVDPSRGDYRVRDGSPALGLGFENFPMDRFGVRSPSLRAIARTPRLPGGGQAPAAPAAREAAPMTWLGAKLRNIRDHGEMSAFGLPGVTGVLVLEVPTESPLAKAGLRKNDVILSLAGQNTGDTEAIKQRIATLPSAGPLALGVSRDQKDTLVQLRP